MRLLRRLQRWWRKEQLITATLQALTARVGVSEQDWPAGTPMERVLTWYELRLAESRTPYGVSAARLVAVQGSVVLLDRSIDERVAWHALRGEVATQLAPVLATQGLTTGVIAIGTAVHAALAEAARQR
jgi:hypothetical protein